VKNMMINSPVAEKPRPIPAAQQPQKVVQVVKIEYRKSESVVRQENVAAGRQWALDARERVMAQLPTMVRNEVKAAERDGNGHGKQRNLAAVKIESKREGSGLAERLGSERNSEGEKKPQVKPAAPGKRFSFFRRSNKKSDI
jgi:hypothetical protein